MVKAPAALDVLTAAVAHEVAAVHDDRAVFPDEVVLDEPGAADRLFPDVPGPVLVLAVENQAVCAWGVTPDGPDPAVLVGGELPGVGRTTVEFAPDVRAYVEARRWDGRCLGRTPLVQAQADPLTDEVASGLAARWEQRPSTHGWPGSEQLRFERGSTRLLLWSSPTQCDWWLSADSEDELAAAVTEVAGLPGLRESLWSNDPAGTRLLDRVLRAPGG